MMSDVQLFTELGWLSQVAMSGNEDDKITLHNNTKCHQHHDPLTLVMQTFKHENISEKYNNGNWSILKGF